MSILLSIEESEDQVVSGIPKFVTISASEEAIIYYTFDGSDPDENSFVASGKIYLPTNTNSFTLKYSAFYQDSFSEVYEEEYATVFEKTNTSRRGGEDGIDIFEGTESIMEYYNSEGEKIESSKVPFEDLEIKTSRYDNKGNFVDSTKSFINFVDRNPGPSYSVKSSTSDINFDRHANFIVVDGSSEEAMEAQVVQVVNRPYGNLSERSSVYIENYNKESSYIGGNLVSYVYNGHTGDIVFYYYDSRENRWIKSIQKTGKKTFDFSRVSRSGNRMVFHWIQDPVMSKLR